jgi:hypothetical protein
MPGGFQMHGLISSPFYFGWLGFLLFTTKEDKIYSGIWTLYVPKKGQCLCGVLPELRRVPGTG